MKKIIALFMSVWTISMCAQFYSSTDVYCYRYVKTINDGISSKLNKTQYYFVNFQNDMMGYVTENNIKTVRQRLLENPDYYADKAINQLARAYNNWKTQPDFNGSAFANASIISYYDEYSTGSKYTYRKQTKNAKSVFDMSGFGRSYAYWDKPTWGTQCYSFSIDMSELIIWKTSDSGQRDYYELVDMDSLKPNTDFLY